MDFTNVKDQGNFNPRRMAAGDYRATIAKVEDHTSKGSTKVDNWVFTIIPTVASRNTYPYYCGFEEKFAWKIRNLLLAAGFQVPKRRVAVDPNKLVGKEIGISLDDEEYEGKDKSVVAAVFPAEELTSDSPSSGRKRSSSSKGSNDTEPAGDDDVSDADLDEMELEEI